MNAPARATRRRFLRLAVSGAGVATVGGLGLAACGGSGEDLATQEQALGKPAEKPPFDTPLITCAPGATQTSVNVMIAAGASGAPAGFSLQWITKAQHLVSGWADPAFVCEAGFSGNASGSRYDLGPSGSVVVNIGEFLFDNGASTDDTQALLCGTEYVFRAFAHADANHKRSAWSADHACATLGCVVACNYSQGYWKTHGPVPTGNNSNEWPVNTLMLGSVAYTDLQLLAILQTPASGNGLIALAHQLIAAKLNVARNGVPPTSDMAAADGLVGALVVPPAGTGWVAPRFTSAVTESLRIYNEGGTVGGPGHCGA